MQPLFTSTMVFLLVFGCALAGMYPRKVMPEYHLGQDTKELIRLGMGLIATLTALVLALMTTTARASFDTNGSGFPAADSGNGITVQ